MAIFSLGLLEKLRAMRAAWKITDTSPFTDDELDQILRIMIVDNEFCHSAQIMLNCGGHPVPKYMVLSGKSFAYKTGDIIDPYACRVITREKDGVVMRMLECRVSPIRHVGKI